MSLPRNAVLWIVWLLVSLAVGAAVASAMYVGGKRDMLLIGKTTGAHHQIELACGACHTSDLMEDAEKASRNMNKACLECHQDELKVSNDSHPVKKFRDPRNAERRELLDALFCASCHAEHVDEITRPMAVTLPTDFCSACHQKIAEERPSHAGLGYETCASAGCHNFHDNTALYEDFLVKHADGPDFAGHAVASYVVDSRADTLPKDGLAAADAVAPAAALTQDAIDAWAGSAHAAGGVNCAGCHAPEQVKAGDLAGIAANWIEQPDLAVCAGCHKGEASTFREGKHGMRLHPQLPKPRSVDAGDTLARLVTAVIPSAEDRPLEPMPVADARIPMKADARAHMTVGTCNACHRPHEVDLKVAAVEACAGCHDDTHTRAYFTSPHYRLWQQEVAGDLPPGAGVSCADCHMPKVEQRGGRWLTVHNQNAYLRPNEKMIRPVCMSCHGLAFAIDALADPSLVESNFSGRPSTHIESIDWAMRRARKTE
ncbi:MAG: ammonia-forming cytochrome c nitrite reductase subunit c552 [Pseudomonadota bacterium]|nr:ammonia-forming cytochrome c nitrite reductase subunit c552 [Pseudomonadota bacterium]